MPVGHRGRSWLAGFAGLAALWLSACATAPIAPPPVTATTGPAAPTPTGSAAGPPSLTAREAIRAARPALAGLSLENWLITAEASPEPPGGRLGAAHQWSLLYRQLDGPLLKVTVPAQGPVAVDELPGGNWPGGRNDRFRVEPDQVAHDSQWAIRLADAAEGAAFLAHYPGSRRSIVLDHADGDPLTWTVDYQTPDQYWALTLILEDTSGRILHRALCEYTPAAMARPGWPNCDQDSHPRDPPFVPLLEPSPWWRIA